MAQRTSKPRKYKLKAIATFNTFVFDCISLGLILTNSPYVSTFLNTIPLERRRAFSLRAGGRVLYFSACCSPIGELKPLATDPEPPPHWLLEKCYYAVLNYDQSEIHSCEIHLKEYLPELSKEKRWEVFIKYLYLWQVSRILMSGWELNKLLITAHPGFCASLRHQITMKDGKFRSRKEINDVIWRIARKPTFQIGFRPIVESAVEMATYHRPDLNYNVKAFDDIFGSNITDYLGLPLEPQHLDVNSNWIRQWEHIARLCGISLKVMNHYITGHRSSLKRIPIRHLLIALYPQRMHSYGKQIARHYLKALIKATHWFETTFKLGSAVALVLALYFLRKLRFFNVEYKTSHNADHLVFPEYKHERGTAIRLGTLVVNSDLVFDYLATSKNNQSRLAKNNKKLERKSKAKTSQAKTSNTRYTNPPTSEAVQSEIVMNDFTCSEFMDEEGQKLVNEFETPPYKF
ncbi:MAG: hypothetical protein LUC43_08335 [Burkholderiales bacterium]|nr:hypothetical protein [Burkholderiales bacterium]